MTNPITIRWHFRAANAAGVLKVAVELPALKGSDKQVAWAEDIRADSLHKVAEDYARRALGIDARKMAIVESLDGDAIASHHAAFDAHFAAPANAEAAATIAKVYANDSAKWWIDNRAQTGLTLVAAVHGGLA